MTVRRQSRLAGWHLGIDLEKLNDIPLRRRPTVALIDRTNKINKHTLRLQA